MLTPGQAHDLACAEPLIENVDPDALIGDKAYDADPFIDTLTERDISAVIPPKTNRKIQRACDFVLYCERNLVERFFNQLKHFRAIATRYDKLARNFLAGVQLAGITILLNRTQCPSPSRGGSYCRSRQPTESPRREGCDPRPYR
jgi:putative transposase